MATLRNVERTGTGCFPERTGTGCNPVRTGTGCNPVRTGTGITKFTVTTLLALTCLLITNLGFARTLVGNGVTIHQSGNLVSITSEVFSKSGERFLIIGSGEFVDGYADITLFQQGSNNLKADQEGTGDKADQEGTGGKADQEGTGSSVTHEMIPWGEAGVILTSDGIEGLVTPSFANKGAEQREFVFNAQYIEKLQLDADR